MFFKYFLKFLQNFVQISFFIRHEVMRYIFVGPRRQWTDGRIFRSLLMHILPHFCKIDNTPQFHSSNIDQNPSAAVFKDSHIGLTGNNLKEQSLSDVVVLRQRQHGREKHIRNNVFICRQHSTLMADVRPLRVALPRHRTSGVRFDRPALDSSRVQPVTGLSLTLLVLQKP